LGIESGATKTVALLETGAPGEFLRGEFGPGNLRLLEDAALVRHLREARDFFAGAASGPLSGVAIAMAGARNEDDRRRIRRAAEAVWPGAACHATNDLEPALLAAPRARGKVAAQVLIVSGTGSCCFGRATDGRTLRFGGWGHILGDRGSGYEIGLSALKAAIHEFDRSGQWPRLGARLLRATELNEPDDLIDWAQRATKDEVGALATEVFEAASQGDGWARGILTAAAETLARDGAGGARRLLKKAAPVQFVLAGSALTKRPELAAAVKRRLRALWPKSEVAALKREAVWGALELARGAAVSGSAVEVKAFADILPKLTQLSPTETRNPRSMKLHQLALEEAIALMIDEETSIGAALRAARAQIREALELIIASFRRGGRLIYVGAGTSGRLGVLDASECPPTFRVPPELVQGVIAGGQTALWSAVEGKEDDPRAGAAAMEGRAVDARDTVMGIAASGRTPFVWGALAEARKRGAKTILFCCNPHLEIRPAARPDVVIVVDVGPEVLTGSTRLKSGTATKIVLNTLTTLAMVKMGKVLSNLMVDVNPSNEKLRERAVRIVQAVTGADGAAALAALEKSGWMVKAACQSLEE